MNDFIDPDVSEVIINKRTELPLVWLLPLIALLVSGWLIAKSINEKGPVITISFPTAEGLEVDKTKIKYLNVEVGKVTAITISDDLKTILITAQMNSSAADYLNQNTSFWVVRPQVGLGGISGLGTLLSGPYIEVKPGDGSRQDHFVGLTAPPLLKNNAEGTHFILETNNLGSMRPGTPINFHGITVGEVLSHKLSDEANSIRLTVFINKPYDQFIRKNTRFWIDSGVDLSAGADGFKVRTGPLISLLSGGIAFRASAEDSIENIQPENTIFQLYDTYDLSTQVVYQNTLKYVMYFNGSVRGLTVGAPVQLRGIAIGKVTDISLELDKKTAEIHIPVTVELEPARIKEINNDSNISDKDIMAQLINKGLRAQLQTGSLLTGQLLVDLDFHPKSKIVLSDNQSVYPEFPTTASSLDQFTHSANIIMDKIAKLPLEDLTIEANKTLQTLQGTSKAATGMLTTAQGTLDTADKTMNSAHQVLSIMEPGSTTHYELERLLQELTQAASSVKQLTDYLEQNPNSLIRGKEEQ
ncbi:MlaD family protein [Methylobacter sp. Wu8]|uniref:Paraquat-inducible protein B n=1 Tax=Methylobacter tundripaludum TaxID=173365 RepID=A0A2S6H2P2_9GAMM|nr:MlaD family protein [Methylobacter tundripaludum]MCF7966664.1 MlaD family protein [Methylobacter tundripaludum]PPK71676.1 paraquat-inducible protein B [Methylobacter tundripaludum]